MEMGGFTSKTQSVKSTLQSLKVKILILYNDFMVSTKLWYRNHSNMQYVPCMLYALNYSPDISICFTWHIVSNRIHQPQPYHQNNWREIRVTTTRLFPIRWLVYNVSTISHDMIINAMISYSNSVMDLVMDLNVECGTTDLLISFILDVTFRKLHHFIAFECGNGFLQNKCKPWSRVLVLLNESFNLSQNEYEFKLAYICICIIYVLIVNLSWTS